MRLAADATECRQRSIDRTPSGSKRDRKGPSIVPCAPTKDSGRRVVVLAVTSLQVRTGTDAAEGWARGCTVAVPYNQKGDARLSRIPSFVSVEIAK
jgi:hypothetical protein